MTEAWMWVRVGSSSEEVVAGGEVDQPALADPDPAAVDLLDDRVQQVVVDEQVPPGRRKRPTSARASSPGAAPYQVE
jgi:hypothetical protein